MRLPAAIVLALLLIPLAPVGPATGADVPLGIPPPETAGGAPHTGLVAPLHLGDDVLVPVDRNQNEYSIVANPLDPDHLVAGANDYSQGDAWAGVYVTRDGGRTWTHGYIPIAGPYEASGDPTLAWASDGTLYYAGIAFNRWGGPNAIFVSKSLDGGATWTTTTPFTHPDRGVVFHDKPWLAVDPATGTLLLTWTHFGAGGGISFTKSEDGGVTWTPRKVLGSGQFSLPVAGPNGEILVVWSAGSVALARSTDGGATFTTSTPMAMALSGVPVPFRYFAYPVIDVARGGPHAGRVYLAAPQRVANGFDLAVVTSDDAGATWSAPETIARPGYPLMPWMAIMPDGTVGIAYMDTFQSTQTWGAGLPASTGDVMVSQALSVKAPGSPAWTTMITTDEPSNAKATTFWGDYQGLAATAKGFHPAFGDARGAAACACSREAPIDFATMRVAPIGLVDV